MTLGYARVSTGEQNLDAQLDTLKAASADHVFADKLSGSLRVRRELDRLFDQLRAGDQRGQPEYEGLHMGDAVIPRAASGARPPGVRKNHARPGRTDARRLSTDKARDVARSPASADAGAAQGADVRPHLAPPGELKHILGQVDADRGNLSHGWFLCSGTFRRPHCGASRRREQE